jgi:CBS domain containing-hemolysin-like protein
MVPKDATVRAVLASHPELPFSRIPIYGRGTDDIAGIVLKSDLYEAALRDQGHLPLADLARPLHPVPEGGSLLAVMDEFSRVGHHLFLVVDEYGGTAGLISVEDLARAILSDLQPRDAEPTRRRPRAPRGPRPASPGT